MIDLDAVPFKATRYPGVSIHFYRSDRESGRAAVLIRMEPGCSYPRHRHTGPEELLVLQGGFRDERGSWRAGEYAWFPAGSQHHPVALDGDEACVFFAIAHEGIELFTPPLDQEPPDQEPLDQEPLDQEPLDQERGEQASGAERLTDLP